MKHGNDEIQRLREEHFGHLLAGINAVKNAALCIEDSFAWHHASEKPQATEGWFLAITKDNLPFLTHYVDGWLPQVHMWQYINIPTHTL